MSGAHCCRERGDACPIDSPNAVWHPPRDWMAWFWGPRWIEETAA